MGCVPIDPFLQCNVFSLGHLLLLLLTQVDLECVSGKSPSLYVTWYSCYLFILIYSVTR